MNIWIILPQIADDFGNMAHNPRFPRADVYVTSNLFFLDGKFSFRLFNHVHNFFRSFTQTHSIRRQRNTMAMSDEKFGSQLLLKVFELPGKRRLSHMQKICRPRHASLSRNR